MTGLLVNDDATSSSDTAFSSHFVPSFFLFSLDKICFGLDLTEYLAYLSLCTMSSHSPLSYTFRMSDDLDPTDRPTFAPLSTCARSLANIIRTCAPRHTPSHPIVM